MKFKKNMIIAFTFVFIVLANSNVVFAATTPAASTSVANEKLVTGTQNLAQWGLNFVMAISAAVSAFLIAKEGLKIQAADEETDTKPYKNRIRTIAIYGVAIILISGLVKSILAFYQ